MLYLTIRNDGTGGTRNASYDVSFQAGASRRGPNAPLEPLFVQARVENFDRERGWHALLQEAVEALASGSE